MQAVILAAGMASRLQPLTNELPKCLLSIHGETILYRMITSLVNEGIRQFIIVVGFQYQQIKDYVKQHFSDLDIRFILNERYYETNNEYSLFLARDYINSNWLLLDSDIVFYPEILKQILLQRKSPILTVVKSEYNIESMKIQTDSLGEIINISKEIEEENYAGESVGIEVFDEYYTQILFDILHHRIFDLGIENEFYESSFQEMIIRGCTFYSITVAHNMIIEIDNQDDLELAKKLLSIK